MSTTNQPTHNIFIVQGDGEKARWIKVGAAWPNQDGQGFSMKLDAVPIAGRIVMRTVKEKATSGGQQ